MSRKLSYGAFRKVQYHADATLFDLEKPLKKAIEKISTKYWKIDIIDHTRPNGERGKLIRIESTNPVRPGRWYVAESEPRPKRKKPTED